MVADVPTFRSTATTQIPSMGISQGVVQQSGTRAMGEGFARVGNFFDVVADYNNKKLDQKMQRDMTKMGQDIASQKGFDPNTLNTDPVTAADQILRESALNTYAITLESDIESSINNAYVKNLRNPEGFKAVSEKYVEKTVATTPWELRNGVSKMALGMVNSKYAAIKTETARRAIAESEAAEKKFLANMADRAILAKSPEELEIATNKIAGMLSNSTAYMTGAGRAAAKQELLKEIYTGRELQEVMVGNVTPLQAKERLEANGVVTDGATLNSFYAAANQKINFEEKLEQRQEKAREKTVEQLENKFLYDAYDAKMNGAEPETFDEIMRLSAQTLRENGATVPEIQKHQDVIRTTIYGDGKDNPSALLRIDTMIDNANPLAQEYIQTSLASGAITPATAREKENKYLKETSDILNNPQVKNYLQRQFIPNHARFARYEPQEIEQLDRAGVTGILTKYSQSEQALTAREDYIIDLVNSGKTVPEALQIVQQQDNLAKPQPISELAVIADNKPYSAELNAMLAAEDFAIKIVTPMGQVITQTDNPIKGRWSNENYIQRLTMMNDQNKLAIHFNQNNNGNKQVPIPYDDAMLDDIIRIYGE